MGTTFTHHWQDVTLEHPAIAARPELGDELLLEISRGKLRRLLFAAFQAGIARHAEVQRELRHLAGEAIAGPAELRSEMQALFGPARRGA